MENKKVLVVDDEQDSIVFVETILKKEGVQVISAADGEEGLQKAGKEKPDLIILDVQMPKMDGFSVFASLRKDDETKSIPVIMLTGIKDKTGIGFNADDMSKFTGEKPNGYVEKPISPEELVKVVREQL